MEPFFFIGSISSSLDLHCSCFNHRQHNANRDQNRPSHLIFATESMERSPRGSLLFMLACWHDRVFGSWLRDGRHAEWKEARPPPDFTPGFCLLAELRARAL